MGRSGSEDPSAPRARSISRAPRGYALGCLRQELAASNFWLPEPGMQGEQLRRCTTLAWTHFVLVRCMYIYHYCCLWSTLYSRAFGWLMDALLRSEWACSLLHGLDDARYSPHLDVFPYRYSVPSCLHSRLRKKRSLATGGQRCPL